jgi:2-methylcitrate dehydratase PrpD
MTPTVVERLAEFTDRTNFADLPDNVVNETKRIVLDSVGCALAATNEPKSRAGIQYARLIGGSNKEATVIGTTDRLSMFGAAFANGELINALDMDAVLPPGHVTPYVLPTILAVGESLGVSGKEIITSIAIAHEIPNRLGKAMDYLRDVKDGKVNTPPVVGYSCTVFGAAATIAKLRRLSRAEIANALGIAGNISPVNSHRAWVEHTPSTTVKYLHAGALSQAAFTASYMAEFGHRGDLQMLDDAEFGYPRFIGSRRWEKSVITDRLGEVWHFQKEMTYKPYPHCRILHALLDALTEIVEDNDIMPDEIERIHAWVEGICERPIWWNRRIERVEDGQFSIAHGISVCAHRIKPGKGWQDPKIVFSDSVLRLMDKVDHIVHPKYVELLMENPASRPGYVEVYARGGKFVGERRYPRGTNNAPEPGIEFTNADIISKFRENADGVIPSSNIDAIVESVMALETVEDLRPIMLLTGAGARRLAERQIETAV